MNTGRKQVDQRTNAAPAIAATTATPAPTTALMLMPNSLFEALEASLAEVAPLLALPLAEREHDTLPLPETPELAGRDTVADPELLPEEVTIAADE